MPHYRLSVCAITWAVASVTAATARAQSLPTKAEVARVTDSLAASFIATRGAPGVSIAVIRGRDTLVLAGWGKADLENDVPATARTVYRIGSITKQFTSSAVLQLVEQGKVKLDDSIGAYLPTLPRAWRGATVRQLLNHTSGIPSYTNIGERWQRRWGEEMSPDTLVALTANDSMWFQPGTKWNYDNSGYVVLGMLVERVAGRPWSTYVADRLAKPLALEDTQNCLTQPVIPRRAHGYADVNGKWTNAPYLAMTQPFAAGAMCSTVGDLARWNRALATGRVVSSASYANMTTPEGMAVAHKYGYGLARDTLAGRTLIQHGGGIPGFISANGWFPQEELSVTVLTNSGSARADLLMAQVARAALGVSLQRPPSKVAITAEDRARYVGTFALEIGGAVNDFNVFERDGELYGQLTGQGANVLVPFGNHTFGASFDPALRIVFTVNGDKATKLTLLQGGQTFEGRRK